MPGVLRVAGVEAQLEVAPGLAEDAARPEARGAGSVSQGPGPLLTTGITILRGFKLRKPAS